jgi:hypothetical protein
MRYATARTWVQYPAATLAALLALGWCAPTRALASCGDHVTIVRHRGDPLPNGFYPRTAANSLPTAREQLHLGNNERVRNETSRPVPCPQCPATPGQAPCEGPWCSGSHAPLPAPTTVEHGQDHWACWWSALLFADAQRCAHNAIRDPLNRTHHVFPIYHPPRAI